MKVHRSPNVTLKKRRQAIEKWPVGFTTLHAVINAEVQNDANRATTRLTLCESTSNSCTASMVLLNSCSSNSCCFRWTVCSARCLKDDCNSSRIKSCTVEIKLVSSSPDRTSWAAHQRWYFACFLYHEGIRSTAIPPPPPPPHMGY